MRLFIYKTFVKPRIIVEKLRRRHAVSYAYALEDRINLCNKERDIYVITGRAIIFFNKNFNYAQKINNNKKKQLIGILTQEVFLKNFVQLHRYMSKNVLKVKKNYKFKSYLSEHGNLLYA